jgi:hypothetical protein
LLLGRGQFLKQFLIDNQAMTVDSDGTLVLHGLKGHVNHTPVRPDRCGDIALRHSRTPSGTVIGMLEKHSGDFSPDIDK